jgi:hypothetical protein
MKPLRPLRASAPIIGPAAGPVSFWAGITKNTMTPCFPPRGRKEDVDGANHQEHQSGKRHDMHDRDEAVRMQG